MERVEEETRRGLPVWLPDAESLGRLWRVQQARIAGMLHQHALLLGILGVALALRWSRWSDLHYYGDDAEYATVAGYLAHNPFYLAYPQMEQFAPTPFVSQPPLLLYLFALASHLTGSVETGAVLVSTLLGVATVALVYGIGVWLDGRITGLVAAAFLALAPMHIDLSRRAFLDAGLTFFFALSVYLFLRWLERPTRGRAVATGFACAAAALSKLPGVLVYAVLGLAILWLLVRAIIASANPERAEHGSLRRLLGHTGLAIAPGFVVLVVYLGLLYYLEGLANLVAKLGWQADRIAGESSAQPWHYYLSSPGVGVPAQFGILFFLFAAAGAIRLLFLSRTWGDRRAGAFAVVAWPLLVGLFFTWGARRQWFYILPIVPAVALLGAFMLVRFGRALARWPEPDPDGRLARRFRVAAVVFVAAFFVVPLSGAVSARATDPEFGHGAKEAALWIHGTDPTAGQVGTLLGRFTLHFYNGQATYHWFNNHTFVEDEIRAGHVRYIVYDTYLDIPRESQWLLDLSDRFHGREAFVYAAKDGSGGVIVYDLAPATPSGGE